MSPLRLHPSPHRALPLSSPALLISSPALLLSLLLTTLPLFSACQPGPEEDYAQYRERTRAAREVDAGAQEVESQLADIRGRWLLRASLNGGFDLGLWVVIDAYPDRPFEEPVEGSELRARLWLDDQDPLADPALVETTISLDAEGRFEMVADPLSLSPAVLGTADPVDAIVRLQSQTRSTELFCGTVLGSVTSPLELNLDGSNFAATRDDEGSLTIEEIPFRCPLPAGAEPPAPMPSEDMAPPDDERPRPEPPALDGVESVGGDLSGHWLLNARLQGTIPLQLWVSLVQSSPPGVPGSIDGAIRRGADPVDAPALATFSAPLDAEGRFEIWLPALRLDTGTLVIVGDILLAALTLPSAEPDAAPDGFCGGAAGAVEEPFSIDLAGTTFFAARWTPGEPPPEELPTACPE